MSDEMTIVVVDDSPSVRETISFILESEGYEVHAAATGCKGLELVRQLRPKAVLTDGMMPEMDGFEMCSHIKAEDELAATQVIMLTSLGQQIDRERAAQAGVDHFATKPFDEDEVLALLEGIYG